MPDEYLPLPSYTELLQHLKERVVQAQSRAVLAVNSELVQLYWEIGRTISERQKAEGWGSKVIDRLARDLKEAFPCIKGFSAANLKYMRYFAENCPGRTIGQQPADQLPWFHIVAILTGVSEPGAREWYASEAVAHGWSRSTLKLNIRDGLYTRQGREVSNFPQRLPALRAENTQQALKDPYFFDFLGLGNDAHEREIESALTSHITRFLLELGTGFAFVGRQFRLEVGGDEFFIDLLFYHTRLKCYIVVELKATEFRPEHAGQLNFYIAAVDAQVKAAEDHPTIGLLLCRSRNRLVAEYALSGTTKPIGIAEYRLVRNLPEQLEASLPAIEDIEMEFSDIDSSPMPDVPEALSENVVKKRGK